MNKVGVSMLALPAGWLSKLLLPPLWSCFCPVPLASSTLIFLPMCSDPLSSRALLRADLVENLTKAKPFGFPSGLFIILTFRIFPQALKRSLISPSKALNERPCTATSNYPSSSSYSFSGWGYYFFVCLAFVAFLVISPEAFLFGAGFSSYYSSDSSFFKGFFAAGFFLAGSGSSDYSSESTAGFRVLGATLATYFEPFLGFGFYSDYYSSESAFLSVFAGGLATIYFDAFLVFGFSEDYSSDFSTFLFLPWTTGFNYFDAFLAFGFSSSDYSSEEVSFFFAILACLAYFLFFVSGTAPFFGAMISSYSSEDESFFLIAFTGATGALAGALTLILGASSLLYSEDSWAFLTGFLATGFFVLDSS